MAAVTDDTSRGGDLACQRWVRRSARSKRSCSSDASAKLTDPGLGEQILRAVGGNPLALVLAADLALDLGARSFATAGEWRLVVRTLVERLLADVRDPALRELLDACAVIRQFDEDILAALAGREQVGAAFARLCRLSVVRPAEHGLMLHDDVRRALHDDLRWRRPDRYQALRARALGYYRERARGAPPGARDWLVAERLFLCTNALVQALLFGEDEPADVWVEPGRPEDHAAVLDMWLFTVNRFWGPELNYRLPWLLQQANRVWLQMLLRQASTRLRVARDPDGQTLGFSLIVPVCQQSLRTLRAHPVLAPLLHAYQHKKGDAALPPTRMARMSTTWFSLATPT